MLGWIPKLMCEGKFPHTNKHANFKRGMSRGSLTVAGAGRAPRGALRELNEASTLDNNLFTAIAKF